MQVTRNVVLDLLPLYLADEASPDTRALIVAFLARDPELAEQVRRQQHAEATQDTVAVPPDLEVRALRRLRRLLAMREWSLGFAWFFSAISFGMEGSLANGGLRQFHFMLFRYPAVFVPILLVAVGCWTAYFWLRGRAR